MRIANTPICIDGFKYCKDVQFYLLSHLHADHTSGLTPTWNFGKIYCTPVSKAILVKKFQVDEKYIVVLELEKTYTFPIQDTNQSIEITCFDANHCLGSCMFLLKGFFGIILCTGDFRYAPFMLDDLKDVKVDVLYLDDTFIESEAVFPTRDLAGKEIEDIIETYSEDHKILIAADTLGKEELFINLAVKFKSMVVVPHERLEIIKEIQRVQYLPDVFTCDPTEGRIHVVSKRDLTFARVYEERSKGPCIGILPSGLLSMRENQYIKHVQYSLHSSVNELEEFVKFLRPKKIYSSSRMDIGPVTQRFGKYLSSEPIITQQVVRQVSKPKVVAKTTPKKRTPLAVIDLTRDLDPEEEQICKILKRTHDKEYTREELMEMPLEFE